MLTLEDINDCRALVAAKWSWLIYNTDDRNPLKLITWTFNQCEGFWPTPRNLSDPLSLDDQKALCNSIQYSLSIEKLRPQLVGFIPVIFIYFIVDLIVKFIIAYWLNKSHFVVKG